MAKEGTNKVVKNWQCWEAKNCKAELNRMIAPKKELVLMMIEEVGKQNLAGWGTRCNASWDLRKAWTEKRMLVLTGVLEASKKIHAEWVSCNDLKPDAMTVLCDQLVEDEIIVKEVSQSNGKTYTWLRFKKDKDDWLNSKEGKRTPKQKGTTKAKYTAPRF